jgi:anti-sigma factor RsiW
MSSTPDQHDPTDDAMLDEQLVAYLDGELDEETGRQIATRIASDPQLRERLKRLGRTWDLLGELERPDAGNAFAQTTLEMVALAAEDEVRLIESAEPRRRRKRWVCAAAGLVAAGAIGFACVALFHPDPNQQLLEDLPALENLDEYRRVDDIEFLRELQKSGLFTEDSSDEA